MCRDLLVSSSPLVLLQTQIHFNQSCYYTPRVVNGVELHSKNDF